MAKKAKAAKAVKSYSKTKLALGFFASAGMIRKQWDSFHHLFLANAQRTKAIDALAPELCDAINTALTVIVYQLLAQLNDPVISNNNPQRRNLVLRRVIDEIAPPAGTAQRKKIDADYQAMLTTLDKLKRWRNAVGAHKDLETAFGVIDYMLDPSANVNPIPFIGLG